VVFDRVFLDKQVAGFVAFVQALCNTLQHLQFRVDQ
jgi:hypothetical protein